MYNRVVPQLEEIAITGTPLSMTFPSLLVSCLVIDAKEEMKMRTSSPQHTANIKAPLFAADVSVWPLRNSLPAASLLQHTHRANRVKSRLMTERERKRELTFAPTTRSSPSSSWSTPTSRSPRPWCTPPSSCSSSRPPDGRRSSASCTSP